MTYHQRCRNININFITLKKTDVFEKQDELESKIPEQSKSEKQYESDKSDSDNENSGWEANDTSFSEENYFYNRYKFEQTSYIVNCMASDGLDVMYSTIEDPQQERIAFCYLDQRSSHYRLEDPSRIWINWIV